MQGSQTCMIAHGRANEPAPTEALAKLKKVSTALASVRAAKTRVRLQEELRTKRNFFFARIAIKT
jgi:hypothetical protein